MATTRMQAATTLGRRISALRDGTALHLAAEATIVVCGERCPVSKIYGALGINERLTAAVNSGQATIAQVGAEYRRLLPKLRRLVNDYTVALRAELGPDNPLLRDFGIRPAGERRSIRNIAMLPKGAGLARRPRARPRRQPGRKSRFGSGCLRSGSKRATPAGAEAEWEPLGERSGVSEAS